MRSLKALLPALLLTGLATVSATAQAQVNGTLTFRGDLSSNGSVSSGGMNAAVGPYKADLNFGSTFDTKNSIIWCVDWTHFAPGNGVSDSYTVSALTGSLSATRLGDAGLMKYLKAAWMIEQVDPGMTGLYNVASSNANPYSAKNVQASIWEMISGSSFGPSGNPAGLNLSSTAAGSYTSSNYFNVTGTVPFTTAKGGFAALKYDWFVLSDKIDCTKYKWDGKTCKSWESDNQEFLVWRERPQVVPEPSTYALMAMGLGALGFAARRRRSQS